MSQLSLFESEKPAHPAQRLFFKVRFTNMYWQSHQDFIHTFNNERDASDALNDWLQQDRNNSGLIYQERKTDWAIQEDMQKDNHNNA